MNQIDRYKFTSQGILDHLRGQIHPDTHAGISTTAKQIMNLLDYHGSTRDEIQADNSLSRTGKQDKIELSAQDAYQDIHKMRDGINYRGHIAQLNQKLDNLANPGRSTEQKLLRQIQLGEIRGHLARLPAEQILSIYNDATATGDELTATAIEEAPGFLFDRSLLGPITAAAQERRRAELDPSLTGQIDELERADSATRMLFNDAEMLLAGETDLLTDIANTEIAMETADAE